MSYFSLQLRDDGVRAAARRLVGIGMLLLDYDAVEGACAVLSHRLYMKRRAVRVMKRLATVVGSARQLLLTAAATTETGASAPAGRGPTAGMRDH